MQQKVVQIRAEDPVETINACSTNSSAKRKRFILQFPTATSSSMRLWLPIQFIWQRLFKFFGRGTWAITNQLENRTSCILWFFRDVLHSAKSTHFP